MQGAAEELGLGEGAVKVALHRLRGRYREALRAEVADTLEDPAAIDDELRALRAALA
jgi:RNA polymerase sigma-70 factor (ECF subfamily)